MKSLLNKFPFLLPISWAVVILILYGISGFHIPLEHELSLLHFDKLVHAGMFATLVVLLIFSFSRSSKKGLYKTHPVWVAVILSFIYGALLEAMQGSLFAGRYSDWLDFIANTIGCALGIWLVRIGHTYTNK